MSRTPSSVAWLNSKYSRAKGQVARMTDRIKAVEARLDLHRHSVRRDEEQLANLKAALAKAEKRASLFTQAFQLHIDAPQAELVGAIRPDEHSMFFKHGGMTTAIFGALRSAPGGVITIDELQSQLMQILELPQRDFARFRRRLQIRLHVLHRQGKVASPDGNGVTGRRWMLSNDWAPTPPVTQSKRYSTHQSKGSIQPALWLIQSQLDIAAAKSGAIARGDVSLASKLDGHMDSIDSIWRQHPLHFEVDLGWSPSSRASHYRGSIYARVARILAQTRHGMTIIALQAACPCPSSKNRQASTRAIGAALRQMLLEGRVEHRQRKQDGQVEWRMIVTSASQ